MIRASRQHPYRSRLAAAGARRGLLLAGFVLLCVPLVAQTRPAVPTGGKGAIIPIKGEINDIMRDSIQRRLDEALSKNVKTVVFEIDTPGGLVTSALDICRIIKNTPPDVRTVAWVNRQAYSAGAMIAVACDEIWMSPSSSVGDCAPIMVSPTGPIELGDAERAKAESPILQEFRDSAARNGYDPLLSRAMVTVGEVVWWIEKIDDPETRRFVSGDEKIRLIDDVAESDREWRLVQEAAVPGVGKSIPIPQPVDRENELLTMSQYDAVVFGFARGIAVDVSDLTLKLELSAAPIQLDKSGWEIFAAWLNSPFIRGLLLIIVFVCAYLEFQNPGMVLPGATALIALAVFLAAPYAAGLANTWTIIVLIVGLALIAVELFIIPGFGIVGLLGGGLLLIALLGTFVPAEPDAPMFSLPTLPGTWDALFTGVKVITVSMLVSLVGIVLLINVLPRTRMAQGVVSDNPLAAALAITDPYADSVRVGDIGVVVGDLRPGGNARFGQEVLEVQSQGEYIETGRRVQVIRRNGMQVVVRPLPNEGTA